MRKFLWLCLVLLVLGVNSAWADGELTERQARALIREMEGVMASFPLEAAAACDADEQGRRSRGTTGSWDETDITCNENVEHLANVISYWSGKTLVWADVVTVWCVAASVVQQAKEILGETPRRTLERALETPELRQKMIGFEILGAGYKIFTIMNTTIGYVNTTIFFDPNQFD